MPSDFASVCFRLPNRGSITEHIGIVGQDLFQVGHLFCGNSPVISPSFPS